MNWGGGAGKPLQGLLFLLAYSDVLKIILDFQLYICGRKDHAYLHHVLKIWGTQCTTVQGEGSHYKNTESVTLARPNFP